MLVHIARDSMSQRPSSTPDFQIISTLAASKVTCCRAVVKHLCMKVANSHWADGQSVPFDLY